MKRFVKIFVFLLVAVFLVAGGRKLVLKRKAELRKEKAVVQYPLPVKVAKVRKSSFRQSARYLGRIGSDGIMTLKARISGQVVKRFFREGDEVRKGDLLVSLGRKRNGTIRELKAQIAVLKAKIASLQIQKKNLSHIYERDTLLYKNGAISKEAWELSQNKLAVIKGEIDALLQEMAQVKTKLAYTKIKSPCDGVVAEYFVKVGDVIFPGQPVCQLIRKGSYKVKVEVTPEDLKRMDVGTPVRVGDVTLKISRIYPSTSPQSLGIFEADFPSQSCPYKVGEILPVQIQFAALKDVWVAPIESLLHKGKETFVFAVMEEKVKPLKVRVLGEEGRYVAISSPALKEGMPLICAHESRLMVLHNDQPVRIVGLFAPEVLK